MMPLPWGPVTTMRSRCQGLACPSSHTAAIFKGPKAGSCRRTVSIQPRRNGGRGDAALLSWSCSSAGGPVRASPVSCRKMRQSVPAFLQSTHRHGSQIQYGMLPPPSICALRNNSSHCSACLRATSGLCRLPSLCLACRLPSCWLQTLHNVLPIAGAEISSSMQPVVIAVHGLFVLFQDATRVG